MKQKTFYVTTPIYYVNDVPHIGHAYTTVIADVVARFRRLMGDDVFFLTGTDEHGQKMEKAAKQAGLTPKQLADQMVEEHFKPLWKKLNIEYTKFVRTTDTDHIKAAQKLFKLIYNRGDIYKGKYEGWYCIPCETFWTDLQLNKGKCPTCDRPVDRLKEESYFFKLSQYQKRLLSYIKKHPDFIQPKSRRNEVIGFIKGGLKDLSVSRLHVDCGVPVPRDNRHTMYVWFDALTNYLTAIGYENNPSRFKRFWSPEVHIIGKDILRFHAVFWPCFLMAAGLSLPKQIFSHGWWTVDGEKMSKSKSNAVDPNITIDHYGADALRYFLLREIPLGEDGDFSKNAFVQRYNSELANGLGNLFSRTLTMITRYTEGRIPPASKTVRADDRQLKTSVTALHKKINAHITQWAFHKALRETWKVIDLANRYIERNAPWKLSKNVKNQERLNTVLYYLAETLRILSLHLFPIIPKTSEAMAKQLGIKTSFLDIRLPNDARWGKTQPGTAIIKGSQLFPRIETQTTEDTLKKEKIAMPSPQTDSSLMTIEDFRKLDLRVGQIKAASAIPGTDKLLQLQVDIGTEVRQVVAGIAIQYRPEELLGKSVILVANLQPAKIRGVESQGMVLAAGDQEAQGLATFNESLPPGTPVK